MFRSTRRPVVYSQAEHARLSATLASAWGNDRFARPAVRFSSFLRGVALHDRGYGELDVDEIGSVSPERWVEIQRLGFAPRGEDPVVDLVVALHIHRLVAKLRNPVEAAALPEMTAALPSLRKTAGVSEDEAEHAADITTACDRIAFSYCFEEPDDWEIEIAPAPGAPKLTLRHSSAGAGEIRLSPWPLGLPWLSGVVVGYELDGYPHRLAPVIAPFRIAPLDT